MAAGSTIAKGASKLFAKAGEAGEGALSEKLGAGVGAKAIQDSISANKLADDALKLLKETDSPVYKTTGADLTSLAKENPKASPEELVSLYRGEGTAVSPKQKATALQNMQAAQPPSPTSSNYVLRNDGDEDLNLGTGLEGMVPQPETGLRGMGALEPTPTTEGVLVGKGETAAQKYALDQKRRQEAKDLAKQSRAVEQDPTEAAVTATPEVPAEVPPVDIPGNKFPTKKVGAAAAGTVAAAAALASAGRKDSEEKAPTTASIVGEIPTSGPFKGKIAPTGAERAASRNIPYDYYDALNKEADKRIEQQKAAYKQSGLSTLPSEREAQIRQEVLDEARKKLSPEDERAAADGLESIGNMIDVVPGGGETAKNQEVKRAPTPPTAPTPKGVDGTKPPVTKPVTSGKESQVTATQALKSTGALAAALEKGTSDKVSKSSLDELTKTLDEVEAKVSADSRFKNSNIERDLVAARADAYKMYKEKADRNQLLGTVERAINAIAQFASAQAGFGTRQAGGNLPLSSADYGGQTEQAFKEYQTEVGLIGEEQKAGERAAERKEALKEKEITRQRGTILERIKLGSDELAQAAAEKRARIAEGGRQASLDAAEARALKRENDAIAKGNVKEITKNLSVLDAQTAALTSMLNPVKPADAVLGLNKYAALTGTDVGGVKEGIAAVSGISWKEGDLTPSFTSNKKATKEFATAELEKIQERRKALADSLAQYTKSVPPAAAPTAPTAAPAGQAAVSSGSIMARVPGNAAVRLTPAAFEAAKKKYPNIEIVE